MLSVILLLAGVCCVISLCGLWCGFGFLHLLVVFDCVGILLDVLCGLVWFCFVFVVMLGFVFKVVVGCEVWFMRFAVVFVGGFNALVWGC